MKNYTCSALAKLRAREKRQAPYINEAEEGRRRVKLAESVRSGDKEDELEKNSKSYTSP